MNLNAKARAGKIDPLIGRETELERTIQILCRRQKNNPLFVGDPGVGKTAIAEGLAGALSWAKSPTSSRMRRFSPSTWERSSPERGIAATSRSA